MKNVNFLAFSFLVCLTVRAQWVQTNGYFGGNINVLKVSGNNLFAGTDKGVYLSVDNGNSWTQVNNGLTNTNIYSMVVNGENVFVGTGGSGVFLSSDNGSSWTAVNNGMTNSDVRSLYFNGTNLFAGTENDGVFISSDNGQTWNSIINGLTNSPFRAFIAFNGAIYAGSNGGGVFKTINNGGSWVQVNTGFIYQNAVNISAFAILGGKIYAGTEEGLYSSTSGSSWTLLTTSFTVKSLEVSGTNLYVGTKPGDPVNCVQSGYTYDPPPGYPTGNYGVLVSSDYANSWTPINNGLSYNQVNAITFLGSLIFTGTLGTGVYVSNNNGSTWISKNKGIGNARVVSLVNDNGILYAGTDGSGVHKSTDGGGTWVEINKGIPDYRITALVISGSILFAGTFKTGLFKSSDGGATWSSCPIIPSPTNVGSWCEYPVFIYALNASSTGRVYVSFEKPGQGSISTAVAALYSTSTGGDAWSLSGNFRPRSIHTSGSYVFAGGPNSVTINGVGQNYDMAISSNSGFSWSYSNFDQESTTIYGNPVISLETIGTNLFAGTGFGVRTSSNNGVLWNPQSFSLPYPYRINALAKSATSVFAGTENNGVYYSLDNFTNAIPVNYGLIDTNISSLVVIGSDLFAGTINGTVWKRLISDVIQPPASAGEISGPTFVCQGQNNVVFTVPPIANADSYVWTLPNGANGSSFTNSINVNFESIAVSGDITVNGINFFGNGASSTLTVTVNPLPNVNAGPNQAICAGGSVTLNATGANTYSWNNGVSNGVAFTPTETLTYTVTGTNSNGCSNTDEVLVTVNALPTVTLNLTTPICDTLQPFTLTGGLPLGGSYEGPSVVSNSFNPAIGPGQYTIQYTYTDINGCSNTASQTIMVNGCNTGSVSENGLALVEFYPNPTFSSVTLVAPEKLVGRKIYLHDLNGKLLLELTLLNTKETINLEAFASGSYFFKIEDEVNTYKLIKY